MTWLIIVLAVALAVAPLLQFMPSKGQRRLARLREHAALEGLFVEFRPLPAGAADRLGSAMPEGTTIYYGRRLPPPREGVPRTGTWLRTEGEWRALGRRLPAPTALDKLPAAVVAAGLDGGSCGVYWTEAGEEEDIDRIRDALAAWSTGL